MSAPALSSGSAAAGVNGGATMVGSAGVGAGASSTSSAAGAAALPSDPDAVWFYLGNDGLQRGPVGPFLLADLLSERSVNSSTLGWRAGLDQWVTLSTVPELKGIFATAFDAPDEVAATAAGKKQGGGGGGGGAGKGARPAQPAAASPAAAASSSAATAAASAAPAAPADPLAVWYYLDKYRAQQGPVRPEQIVHLYKMLQLNDASLVWCATAGSGGAAAGGGGAAGASQQLGASSNGWVRLAEAPQFEGQLGPEVLEAARAERDAAEAQRLEQKKRKREKQAAAATTTGTKWKKNASAANNTNVYITGLPLDVTLAELLPVAKKAGIIQTDETDNPRVKIYTDEQGKPKGDALVKYALPTSVELAITLLDQSVFRPAAFAKPGSSSASASSSSAAAVENKDYVITVQRAEFEMKGSSFDSSRVDPRVAAAAANKKARLAGGAAAAEAARAKVGAMTAAEIQKQRLADSLSWAEDDDFADLVGGSSGSSRLRIVILKPMFTLAEAAAHPDGEEAFYDELKSEIGAEVETKVAKAVAASTGEGMNDGAGVRGGAAAMHGKGCIEKLTVFAGNELGPVAVKFRTAAHASACIALMNGRLFAGQKLQAFYFDGKTNYVVKPKDGNDEETQKRLDEFGDWIERGGDQHEE